MPEQVNEPVDPNVNGPEVLSADSAPVEPEKVKKADVVKPHALDLATADSAPVDGVDTFDIIAPAVFGADEAHAVAMAQKAADDAVRLDNPNAAVVRENNPAVGGESFDVGQRPTK